MPFGHQKLEGVVVGTAESTDVPDDKLVAITAVREDSIPRELVDLALWMAEEYCSTPARALALRHAAAREGQDDVLGRADRRRRARQRQPARAAGAPAGAGGRRSAGAAAAREARAGGDHRARRAARAAHEPGAGPASSSRRRRRPTALAAIEAAPGEAHLLHGVTGSGKTEVYLRAAAAALERGRGRDRARAGDRADAADRRALRRPLRRHRRAAALRLERGRALRRVAPPAHGRGADRRRPALGGLRPGRAPRADRRRRGARRLLQAGERPALRRPPRRRLPRLPVRRPPAGRLRDPAPGDRAPDEAPAAADACGDRAGERPLRNPQHARRAAARLAARRRARLPPVRVLDMRGAQHSLHPETRRALAATRKSIVLLNRRGWSNFLTCRACGKAWECPNCDVALVLHRAENALACHHCGHRERVPSRCDACGSLSVARHGAGTERVEAELAAALDVPGLPPRRRHGGQQGRRPRAARPLPRRARRPAARHADGGQGPRLPGRHARRRARRRLDAALPRLPRRGAHVRADRPARRPRRPRAARRPRARPDQRSRRALDRRRRPPRRRRLPARPSSSAAAPTATRPSPT